MEPNELGDLYRDSILDHCRNPRNHDRIEDADATGRSVNPFCGDEVDIQVSLDDGRVAAIGVQAVGCSINQASASIMAEVLEGKTVDEVKSIGDRFRQMMAGDGNDTELAQFGDLSALTGVREFPVRIKCALLPWSALEDALEA